MKKGLLMILLVVMIVCSFVLPGSAETAKLRIAWWGSQDRHDRTLKAIKLFEERYPEIDIVPEFLGWDGYWEKMAAQSAGNNLPDVWQQDYAYLTLYANRGLLLNLNDYIDNKSLDLTDVDDSAISGGIIDEKLYGVNLGLNAMMVVYDPELFAQAGVAEPTPGWTWEDYMSKVIKIHDKLGIYGDYTVPQAPPNSQGLQYFLRQQGKDLYNAAGDGLGYDDDDLFVQYFKMDLELAKKGAVAPIDLRAEISNGAVEQKLIVSKKAAMDSYIWSNQIVALESAAGRKFKMMVLPKDKNQVQEGLYLKPSQFFSVTKYTKYPEAAVKFINFFTNDLECNKILMAERGVPIASHIREGLKPDLKDVQKRMFDYINLAAEHSSKISPPDPEGYSKLNDTLEKLNGMILYDLITPEEAAKEYRQKAEEILGK